MLGLQYMLSVWKHRAQRNGITIGRQTHPRSVIYTPQTCRPLTRLRFMPAICSMAVEQLCAGQLVRQRAILSRAGRSRWEGQQSQACSSLQPSFPHCYKAVISSANQARTFHRNPVGTGLWSAHAVDVGAAGWRFHPEQLWGPPSVHRRKSQQSVVVLCNSMLLWRDVEITVQQPPLHSAGLHPWHHCLGPALYTVRANIQPLRLVS